MKLLEKLEKRTTLVIVIFNLVLAIITFSYLLETKSLRKIAEKNYRADTSPKIFVNLSHKNLDIDYSKNEFSTTLFFTLQNIGKTKAVYIFFEYEITSNEGRLIKHQILPIKYLFPNQKIQTLGQVLSGNLKKEKDYYIFCHVRTKISYTDNDGNKYSFRDNFSISTSKNAFVYISD